MFMADILVTSASKLHFATNGKFFTLDASLLTDVKAAIADLPAAIWGLFSERLVGVYFVEGLGGTGVSDYVFDQNAKPVAAFIVLDAAVLKQQRANAWATWKENTPFKADPRYRLDARIEADGNDNRKNAIQYILLHELGHEWWANLVTASDWRDFWIHEGFQSFMDSLYQEHLHGQEEYFAAMKKRVPQTRNMQPVAPREPKIAYQVYMAEPEYLKSDGDIYTKGALVLHTLRYLIGDEAFFKALRQMTYPTKQMETYTDGRQTRLVNTDDFLTIAEAASGMDLDWFFEIYLRQPKLPKLISQVSGNTLNLRWETPNNMPFPMTIDVEINSKIQRVEMKDSKGTISFTGSAPVVDPKSWVLKTQ